LTDSKNSTKSGRFLELLGSYDPRKTTEAFNGERIKEWMSKGAKLSDTMHNLLISKKIIEDMKIVREVVTLGLDTRQKIGARVRQPLSFMSIPYDLSQDFLDIIADEVNVKEVKFINSSKLEINPEITSELKQEGDFRDLIRALQDMRKKMGLTPSDVVALTFETNDGNHWKGAVLFSPPVSSRTLTIFGVSYNSENSLFSFIELTSPITQTDSDQLFVEYRMEISLVGSGSNVTLNNFISTTTL